MHPFAPVPDRQQRSIHSAHGINVKAAIQSAIHFLAHRRQAALPGSFVKIQHFTAPVVVADFAKLQPIQQGQLRITLSNPYAPYDSKAVITETQMAKH